MCTAEPDGDGNERRQDDEILDRLAGGDAPGTHWRKTELEWDGQQPRHPFFGQCVHYQVREHANDERTLHKADVDMWHNRLQKLQQEQRRAGKARHAKQ